MAIKIQITGIPKVRMMLAAKNAQAQTQIGAAIKQAGFFVQGEVVESVAGHRAEPMSVDTGRFKNSVKSTFPKKFEAKIESNVEYAQILESGGKGRQPRHHFKNSAKRNEQKVRDFIIKKLKLL